MLLCYAARVVTVSRYSEPPPFQGSSLCLALTRSRLPHKATFDKQFKENQSWALADSVSSDCIMSSKSSSILHWIAAVYCPSSLVCSRNVFNGGSPYLNTACFLDVRKVKTTGEYAWPGQSVCCYSASRLLLPVHTVPVDSPKYNPMKYIMNNDEAYLTG